MAKGMVVRRGGGGLPSGWTEEVTATFLENINAGDPIEYCMYPGEDVFNGSAIGIPSLQLPRKGLQYSQDGNVRIYINNSTKTAYVQRKVNDAFIDVFSYYIAYQTPLDVEISSDGLYGFICERGSTSPDNNVVRIFKWNGTTYTLLTSIVSPTNCFPNAVKLSSDDKFIMIGNTGTSSPILYTYGFENEVVTPYGPVPGADTANVNGITTVDIECSIDGSYWVWAYKPDTGNRVSLLKRTGSTTALIYNNIAGSLYGCAIAPDASSFSLAVGSTPYIRNYSIVNDTVTLLSNPVVLPSGSCNGCAYSPDGKYLIGAHETAPYVAIYKIEGTTFTKLANPALLPAAAGYGALFFPDGRRLIVYQWAGAAIEYLTGVGDFIIPLRSLRHAKHFALNQYGYFGVGMAKETKLAGQQGKAMMFKKINDAQV